jgi:hypothetical protein
MHVSREFGNKKVEEASHYISRLAGLHSELLKHYLDRTRKQNALRP